MTGSFELDTCSAAASPSLGSVKFSPRNRGGQAPAIPEYLLPTATDSCNL